MDILRRFFWSNALIPVSLAPEPDNFDTRVRIPGNAFLTLNPNPTASDWKRKNYWSRAHADLFAAYNGLCSYCASWTRRGSSPSTLKDSSVDHFIPKSVDKSLAYEWFNYRLCRARLNTRKESHQDVLDPFDLIQNSFELDLRSFLLRPRGSLDNDYQTKVQATIDRLELNTDNDYVNERIAVIEQYCINIISPAQLRLRYPFIADELSRQDFDNVFLPKMKEFFLKSPFSNRSAML